MRKLRPAGLTLGALLTAAALGACGGASPATSATLSASVEAAATGSVAVSPQPGTPDASPSTQISFLGGAGHDGLRRARGRLAAAARTRGVAARLLDGHRRELPAQPAVPRRREGDRARAGRRRDAVSTSFTIAHQAPVSQKQFPLNPGDARAVQHYSSAPTLTPSTVRITTAAKPGAAPGDLFLAPYQGKGTPGPMIADQDGNLVWFKPLPAGESATNFQVAAVSGQAGARPGGRGAILEVGFGQGEDEIYDSSYQHVATVRAGNGYHADLHEIRLTPEGTAWIDDVRPDPR